jgi:hypothetical protein
LSSSYIIPANFQQVRNDTFMTMSMSEQNKYVDHVGSITRMSIHMLSLELYIRKSVVRFRLEAVQVLPQIVIRCLLRDSRMTLL